MVSAKRSVVRRMPHSSQRDQWSDACRIQARHLSCERQHSSRVNACISELSLREQQHRHEVRLQPKLTKQAAVLTIEGR